MAVQLLGTLPSHSVLRQFLPHGLSSTAAVHFHDPANRLFLCGLWLGQQDLRNQRPDKALSTFPSRPLAIKRENLSLTWPTLRKKRDNGQVGKVRTYQVLGQPPSSHISLSFGCCGCPGHNSLLERSFLSFFGTVPS